MQERPTYVENVLQRLAELQRWVGHLNPRQRAELSVDVDRLTDDLRVLFSAEAESLDATSTSASGPAPAVSPDSVESSPRDAQRQLLEGDELFRSLATNVDLVLWLRAHDTDQILYVSPAYETLWGQTRESLYRSPGSFMDAIHPEDRERVRRQMAAHRQGGFNAEFRVVKPDGSTRWILARTFPVSGRHSGTARVAGVAQDITEQKATVEALRTTLTRMRERYLISRSIAAARSAEDVVSAVRSLTPLQQASRLTVLVFDEPWEDVVPSRLEALVDWHADAGLGAAPEESLAFAEYPFAQLFARDGAVPIGDAQTDTRLSEDARTWLARINTRSLLLFPLVTSGQWYGMLNIHFPVPGEMETADREYYEKVVNQAAAAIYNFHLLEAETLARKEAERANEVKFRFLAMISHELRTPLTSIKGFATTLLADDVTWDAASQRDFLETINQEADKLTELIEQLLDLSRLESGTLRIVPQEQPLSAIVDASVAQLQALTGEHRLVVSIPDDLPPVWADAQRIGQVLANLVNNASKFSPSGTQISISATHKGKEVQVNATDHGSGIAPEERALVFESFYQTAKEGNSSRRARGVGLGLAICRGLVEAHGGRIWVQDRPGPGTTISFTLPIVEAARPSTV
jgi:PAS domain S-box-containing protein